MKLLGMSLTTLAYRIARSLYFFLVYGDVVMASMFLDKVLTSPSSTRLLSRYHCKIVS